MFNITSLLRFAHIGAAIFLLSQVAQAGGIALGATRVIYPAGATQTSLSINNSDGKTRFLIQSWVEDDKGNKTADFVVTPPLFVAKPKGENTLRIMYIGKALPGDRESVFWMNVKAIPSTDKSEVEDKNVLQLAVLSRIKLFVRPSGLPVSPADAPDLLGFHREGGSLRIDNPSPYFITLVNAAYGAQKLPNTMVPPKSHASVPLPADSRGNVTFQTINDYGANTPKATGKLR